MAQRPELSMQVPGMAPHPTAYPGLPQGTHVPAYGDPRRDPLLRCVHRRMQCIPIMWLSCDAGQCDSLLRAVCDCAGVTRTSRGMAESSPTAVHVQTQCNIGRSTRQEPMHEHR
jgi:hypothetical protein